MDKTRCIAALVLIAIGAGSGAITGFHYGVRDGMRAQGHTDLAEVKSRAIENGCGEYDRRTGVFRWLKVERADELLASTAELHRALEPLPVPGPRAAVSR